MLQQEVPEDYVISTGRQETVRKFIEITVDKLGWGKIIWEGKGINEVGKLKNGKTIVKIDPRYFRPTEVETLLGDSKKAHEKLGWKPRTSLETMIQEMVIKDLEEAKKESLLREKGYEVYSSFESPPNTK